MEKHIEKEKFFQRYKAFFLSCKDDIIERIYMYTKDELQIMYDIITKDSYMDYRMYSKNRITNIKLFKIIPILRIDRKK